MNIKIVKDKISKDELKNIAREIFGEMVKAVVDVKKEIMAVGGELHADSEALLLKDDSNQDDLWGINIYPDKPAEDWIIFTALINIRPRLGNKSMEIQDKNIRERIKKIIDKLVE